MPKLTIITACSRPENLTRLAESIAPGRELFDLTWLVVLDGIDVFGFPGAVITTAHNPRSVVGNHQKNAALDLFQAGWVYFLDDDNLIHPDFFPAIRKAIDETDASAFVFAQAGGVSPETARPCPENVYPDRIDLAQVCLTRALIGESRLTLHLYNADGVFYQSIYLAQPGEFAFIERPLCYYNKLREGQHVH